jgi:predicted Rossmann-fold nucleotide-binding protein
LEKSLRNDIGIMTQSVTGNAIANACCKTICGGSEWTFNSAFTGAKEVKGLTKVIIENCIVPSNPDIIDEIIFAANQQEKHKKIVSESSGAIVIGGGPGSVNLIKRMIQNKLPVYMINNTGGITEDNNFKDIPHIHENKIMEIVKKICGNERF